jgi:acyl-CoA dehydrogenase
MNNLKVSSSEMVAEIVQRALSICGIMAYKNDTPFSLGRHLRDALSAALMIGNDRILSKSASMLLVYKDD